MHNTQTNNYSNGYPQSQQTLTKPIAIINDKSNAPIISIHETIPIYIYKIDSNDVKSDDDNDIMLDTVSYNEQNSKVKQSHNWKSYVVNKTYIVQKQSDY